MDKILRIFNPSLAKNTQETLDSEEVNSTEINIAQVENQLQNWSIPKQEIKTIYKIGTFEKKHDYAIKQTENTISLYLIFFLVNFFRESDSKYFKVIQRDSRCQLP